MTGNYYDIIVAGGGPAGLSAARAASRKGLEVLLLELQAQIGSQTQTSTWVPSQILDERFDQATVSSVEKVNLHSMHQELEIEGEFGEIVDRKVLDKIFASEAVEEGLDIWVGSPVRDLLEGRGGIRGVKLEAGEWSEEIESEVVIDATGAKAEWSSLFLRKVLNSNWNKEKVNQTNEYLLTNVAGESETDIYFNSVLAPAGHSWVYPMGDNFAMAGIRGVRIHPDSALDEFIGREKPDRIQGSVPIGAYRGQIPVEGLLETSVSDGILAVGSSAGQVYPFSGHGMKYALEGGKIAGKVAAEAVSEGDTTEGKLAEYEDLWGSRFEKEIEAGSILQSAIEISPDQKMDSLLENLGGSPELQNDFMNIFFAEDLEKSIPRFFKNEECKRIFGEKKVSKLLSLYK